MVARPKRHAFGGRDHRAWDEATNGYSNRDGKKALTFHSSAFLFLVQGFDEFMNVTLDDASEVYVKTGKDSRYLGECLR